MYSPIIMLLLPNVINSAVPYVIVIFFMFDLDLVTQVVGGCEPEPFAIHSEIMVVASCYETFDQWHHECSHANS